MKQQTLTDRTYSAAEFAMLPNAKWFELIDGRLFERRVSVKTSAAAVSILSHVGFPVRGRGLGRFYDSTLHVHAFPWAPDTVRRPHGAFVQRSRVPRDDAPFLEFAPDWVLETVSPNDYANEVRAKVDLWLRAGVRMVWVAHPQSKEIHVYRPGVRPTVFTAEHEITGEDVIPGFSAQVAVLFPVPLASQTQA